MFQMLNFPQLDLFDEYQPYYTLECSSGYFGDSCVSCHHCKDDDICDAESGECPHGCAAGYTGDMCQSG